MRFVGIEIDGRDVVPVGKLTNRKDVELRLKLSESATLRKTVGCHYRFICRLSINVIFEESTTGILQFDINPIEYRAPEDVELGIALIGCLVDEFLMLE